MLGPPSASRIFFLDLARFLPLSFIEWMQDHVGGQMGIKARECAQASTKVAKELIDTKVKYFAEGKSRRDVLSLLGTRTNTQ